MDCRIIVHPNSHWTGTPRRHPCPEPMSKLQPRRQLNNDHLAAQQRRNFHNQWRIKRQSDDIPPKKLPSLRRHPGKPAGSRGLRRFCRTFVNRYKVHCADQHILPMCPRIGFTLRSPPRMRPRAVPLGCSYEGKAPISRRGFWKQTRTSCCGAPESMVGT